MAFKQSFPEVGPGTSSAGEGSLQRSTLLSDAPTDTHIPNRYAPPSFISLHSPTFSATDIFHHHLTMVPSYEPVDHADDDVLTTDDYLRHFGDLDDIKEHEATPKPLQDTWRFTPSLMDPNSFAFTTFANQPPGYYTPTPGGVNTLYHSQAGDLHTPGMGMNIGTPLSMPHTANALHAQDAPTDLQHFHPHMLQPPHFHNPFGQQQSYAPSNFLQHQDSGYDAIDTSPLKSPANAQNAGMPPLVSGRSFPRPVDGSQAPPSFPFAEK